MLGMHGNFLRKCLIFNLSQNKLSFILSCLTKNVEFHTKLFDQKLVEGEDVMEYISCLKNLILELIICGIKVVEESLMASILISRLPPSYKHFLETLQIDGKLENQNFDSLGDLFVQHDKTFGQKNSGKELLFTHSRKRRKLKRKRGIQCQHKRKRYLQ
jgi:hypothetical protein